MLWKDYVINAVDHFRGRSKTAFPTRFHYLDLVKTTLYEEGIMMSRLGKHLVLLEDKHSEKRLIVIVRYATEHDRYLVGVQRQRYGNVPVAYLLDDDIWAMVSDEKQSRDYRDRLTRFLKEDFEANKLISDVFLAPNERILARCPELDGQLLLPVHMDPSEDLAHFEAAGKIQIGYLSSSSHFRDFADVAPGIKAALNENPRLHLTTLLGKRGEELIPSGSQVSHLGDMFFEYFQRWLSRNRFHIALAPYQPSVVNDARSNLKIHQHAFVGAAGLYAPSAVFRQYVADGKDGLLVEQSASAWKNALSALANDPKLMRELARSGIETSKKIGSRHEQVSRLRALF